MNKSSCTTERTRDMHIINVKGSFDVTINSVVEQKIDEILLKNKDKTNLTILFDFSKVSYISYTGINTLLGLERSSRESNFQIFLCALRQDILKVLELLEVTSMFEIYASRDEAVHTLSKLF